MAVYGAAKPRYESPDQIEGLVEQYFDECAGKILKDDKGDPILDKFGQPIFIGKKQPTSAGLARALGFNSRQSLLNYKAKKEFRPIIEYAMLRLEEATEQRLYDKDGARGAQFSLRCNFKHWKDETEDVNKAPAVNIICDIPRAHVEKAEEKAEDGSKD